MNLPKEFNEFKLERPQDPPRRRLVMSSEGDTGCGKSDFFLRTAPRPLLQINLDMNLEGLEERYKEDDGVYIKHVRMPVTVNQERDKPLYDSTHKLIMTAIQQGFFRSISIDTGGALYELCRRRYFGKLGFQEAKQSDYDVVNGSMRRIYHEAKRNRVNLIVTHHRVDEYKDKVNSNTGKIMGSKTGQKVMSGWKHAKENSQCHVLFEKDPKWRDGGEDRDWDDAHEETTQEWDKKDAINKFIMTVLKCTANTFVEGRVFRGDEISLPILGMAVFPASKRKEWE